MTKPAGLLERPGTQQRERVSAKTGRGLQEPVAGIGKHFFVEYLVQEKNRQQHQAKREEMHQGTAMNQDQFFSFFEALRREIALNRLEFRQLEARMDDWRVKWEKEKEQIRADHEATNTKVQIADRNEHGLTHPDSEEVDAGFAEEETVRIKKEEFQHWREVYRKRYPIRVIQKSKDIPEEKKDLRFLVQEIKRLEEKKVELIQDNIMINQLSEELLAENQRLQGELERVSSSGRKAS